LEHANAIRVQRRPGRVNRYHVFHAGACRDCRRHAATEPVRLPYRPAELAPVQIPNGVVRALNETRPAPLPEAGKKPVRSRKGSLGAPAALRSVGPNRKPHSGPGRNAAVTSDAAYNAGIVWPPDGR
jgi:hypothetical protein